MDLDTLYVSMYLDSDHDTLLALKSLKYCSDNDDIDDELETIELDDDCGVYPGIYSPRMPLHQAIEARRASIVEALLKQNAYTANSVDKYSKFYPLHVLTSVPETEAVIDRIVYSMQNTATMIKHINTVNYKNIISEIKHRAKKMYLHKSTFIEIIKEVLRGNTEISDDDLKRMENTIKQNELKISELLFSKGADIDAMDKNGYTPLRNAVINGNLELTKLFISRNADITLYYDGFTIFEVSALSPNVDVVKEIVRTYGCNVHSDILIDASERGHASVIKYLLDIGLNIKTNSCGETPLHRAASVGSSEVVDVLLSYGAEVNVRDVIGNTPLISASAYTDTTKLLIEKGANIHISDNNGYTALHNAARYGSLESIDLFLSYGIDVDIKDKIGNTPLFYASPYPDVVKALLEKGANPNTVNSRGLTPLSRTIDISDLSTQHIVSHIMLLEYRDTFNSQISTVNANLIKNNVSINEMKVSCKKELERMKSIHINSKYSLITFITTDNVKLLSKLVRNTVIDSIDTTCFQIYGPLIKRSINTAIELCNKFDTVMSTLSSVLEDTCWKMLPVEIQRQILFMLEESELPVVS
ncbi:ankyrin repeat protein [Canarypox virus]|uniref:CNPV011 ankyrin repeat protein n=1 Tax=Canarypox virus TaxID=44088 RepID=Q6VZY6_CNPV|nr:ankyrin repeat protein [Canarypox virus]AAR83357.1 CNPV011 ankyrin repeat protein [Canarypox virus]AWD84487.1 ankyrin repeat protein [Canarypox virus]